MIGAKVNLAKLKHVIMEEQGQNGTVKGLFLPIEANNLYMSEKGNVYLDLIAFDLTNPKDGDTHIVKQSLPKDVREKMSEQELKDMPILGNMSANIGKQESAPANAAGEGAVIKKGEKLPF